jgi:transcriptional regulator with XRE-family HTH domain
VEKLSGMESTAQKIKAWREANGLTPEEAAARARVSLPTWSRWENGRRKVAASRAVEIEALTGIPSNELRPDIFKDVAA